jgi:hypothetical protein
MFGISTPKAVKKLQKELRRDAGFRYGYKANIAMQFKEEAERYMKRQGKQNLNKHDIELVSNRAAENFLTLFCKE